ncbi:histidine phosphatase family protein [Thermaerobacillus caldiproteolyticus]|uniref:histidine phosphatase family protein n=1 Tax=Thermaerobacillus caldiproteolyticus TaxID=247480 RepID=UPI00188A54DA|nr:histidine phosphatase family protein [Anoxybacillus caldiproteolyticus]QPA33197.1 histidine phosphatase family protein [Anoxybacillus caldiproteolyticus]
MVHHLAITFLRHGITKENEEKRYIGFTDVPLAEHEIVRLHEAGIRLYPSADFIVSSDLIRCRQTCEILFRSSDVLVYETEEWREIHFGDWEGKTFAELKEIKEYQQWLQSSFSVAPPNGESYAEFQARIETALARTVELAGRVGARHVTVVTHGGPIRYVLERYAPIQRSFWEWTVPFGGGFTLESTLERWREKKRCISLSEVLFKGRENGHANIID